jgi:hypothetical protein
VIGCYRSPTALGFGEWRSLTADSPTVRDMGSRTVWVGFVNVVPDGNPDAFDGAIGAYVWAATEAASRSDYERRVAEAAALTFGLKAVSVEDVAPALSLGRPARRTSHGAVVRRARKSGDVEWGTFHSYGSEDEDDSSGTAPA